MEQAEAWILDFNQHYAAVGQHFIIDIQQSAKLYSLPLAPNYCNQLMLWRDQIIPVLDIGYIIHNKALLAEFFVILSYETGNTVQHAAIPLASAPFYINVNNSMACDLPKNIVLWEKIAIACFYFENKAIPIIDISPLLMESLL